MKNIFQIDDIIFDFNLTDLLRGKIHVEKAGVEGVAIGTYRKTSGELKKKEKKSKEKSKAAKAITAEKDKLVDSAKNQLIGMFAQYNPETIVKDLQNDLKSPALGQTIYTDVQEKIKKWQNTPVELEKSVNEFSSNVQTVLNTDWSNVKDVAKIKSAIETVKGAINQGQELSDTITKTMKDIQSDTQLTVDYAKQIQDAIVSDKNLVENKVNDVKKLFSVDGLTEIMSDAVKGIIYDYAGKYGPYVTSLVDTALSSVNEVKAKVPASDGEKKESKKKKESRKRLAGRDIYYRKDRVPKLLIEEAVASGYEFGTDQLLFKGVAKNISSNQNMVGKNTTVDANFKILGNPNEASIIIDARTNAEVPLVNASYNGHGFDISANAEVFALTSKSDITAMLTADKDGSFTVGGILDMNVSSMTGMDFEPAEICRVYKNALSEVKELTLGFGIGYSKDGKLSIELKNLDKLTMQLVNPVKSALMKEVNGIMETAKTEALKMLTEKTGLASDSIMKFTDISTAMGELQNKSDGLKKQLEQKQTELTDMLSNYAKNAAGETLKDVIPTSGGGSTKESAEKALKGLFGR